MAQNGVIFHLLQTLAHLFIEESWPLGKCPSFLLSPFVSSYVSIGLPPSQSDQHTEVPPMYLRCFSSMQCSSCLDSRRLASSCPRHTSLIAACLLTCCQESSFFFFFRQKCTGGVLAADQKGVLMQVRKLHCL